MALLRILLENVRGPITEHVLTYACGKMLGGFADISGITARTYKLMYHTRTEHVFKKRFVVS